MKREMKTPDHTPNMITRKEALMVALWAAMLIALYVVLGYLGVRQLHGYTAQTEEARKVLTEAPTIDPGAVVPETIPAPEAEAVDVRVGICMNGVEELSIKEAGWTADFDVWFGWTGDEVSPGETFRVFNGEIIDRKKIEEYVSGKERYERYRVKARISKSFDPSRFPFGDEVLAVGIEDEIHGVGTLCYVADDNGGNIGYLVIPGNPRITKSLTMVKLGFRPCEGDPGTSTNGARTRSRFIFAMLILPPGKEIYLKMFQALFCSVAIALLAFFVEPNDTQTRSAMGVGAFFVIIGNNIYVNTLLPLSDRVTLSDMINGVGMATIFFTLVGSAISFHLFERMGKERLSRRFDTVSFVILLVGFTVLIVLLPLAASP